MELSNCVKIFKALSNEQRLRIFIMIYNACYSKEGKGRAQFPVEDKACCPVADVLSGLAMPGGGHASRRCNSTDVVNYADK